VKLHLRRTYETYLTNASERYGKAKSFFIRSTPTRIYDFYVPLGVTHEKKRITHIAYADVVALTTRAVVTGAAGSGKSMLMRHLFLSALADGTKVPIFVELRNANTNSATVSELIFDGLRDYGFTLEDSFISRALEAGHFAILLDGYDEIAHSRRHDIARDILALSQSAPNCTIMVSSRPDDIFGGWQDFSSLEINPLTLYQRALIRTHVPISAVRWT
ncbi:MAG: NACHT domain-containing protein, partial [Proteobacteria bacterium]|nr:NACHT domain-containing protein [Pseudomonadota bacterium]